MLIEVNFLNLGETILLDLDMPEHNKHHMISFRIGETYNGSSIGGIHLKTTKTTPCYDVDGQKVGWQTKFESRKG